MRVIFEHREHNAVMGRDYFLDTTIELSHVEKAIIEQRYLQDQIVATGLRDRPPSDSALELPALIRQLAPLALLLSAGFAFFIWTGLGILLILCVVGAWIYAYVAPFLHARACKPLIVKVGQIQKFPKFSFFAPTPHHCKNLADDVEAQLMLLKTIISGSAELGETQTFEL